MFAEPAEAVDVGALGAVSGIGTVADCWSDLTSTDCAQKMITTITASPPTSIKTFLLIYSSTVRFVSGLFIANCATYGE